MTKKATSKKATSKKTAVKKVESNALMTAQQVKDLLDRLLFNIVASIELTDQQQQKPIIEQVIPIADINAVHAFVLANKTEEKEEANVRLVMAEMDEYEVIVRADTFNVFAVFKKNSELMYAFKQEEVK